MLLLVVVAENVCADDYTYTFKSKSWESDDGNWINVKDGGQYSTGRGIQITSTDGTACAISPASFVNVSKVIVNYCTNANKGAGSVSIGIGNNTVTTKNVTKTGGDTHRNLEYNYNPTQSGSVTITVNCTTNSIYINSITITAESSSSNTVYPPTFSVSGGTYYNTQSVELSTTSTGAIIYYTTDGSTPTTDSSVYSTGITIDKTTTLKAIAVKNDNSSEIAEATYTLKTATPSFSPIGGTYNTSQSVTLSTQPSGATIYYTLDGSDPTTDSDVYSSSLDIIETTTIKAMAVYGEFEQSDIASAVFIIEKGFYFQKATSLSDLKENAQIIIVNEAASVAMGQQNSNGNNFLEKSISITENIATVNYDDIANVTVITLENAGENNMWYLRTEAGYLYAASSSNNFLKVQGTANSNAKAKISFDGDEMERIVFQGSYSRNKLQYNSSSNLFSCYINNQNPVAIYYRLLTENVTMKTAGYASYVTKNDIDWSKTKTVNEEVHGYKVTEFSKQTSVFAEFGEGDNEIIIPAGTPVIIKGVKGPNSLVLASNNSSPTVKNNKLKGSDGTVAATTENHLLVLQKTSAWTEEDPYNNYAFYQLKEGRTIPAGKAYLDGQDVSETITTTTNAAKGIYLFEDLQAGVDGEEGVTTGLEDALQPLFTPKKDYRGETDNDIGEWFLLDGRPVGMNPQKLSKGIYVVNGRKVVIK